MLSFLECSFLDKVQEGQGCALPLLSDLGLCIWFPPFTKTSSVGDTLNMRRDVSTHIDRSNPSLGVVFVVGLPVAHADGASTAPNLMLDDVSLSSFGMANTLKDRVIGSSKFNSSLDGALKTTYDLSKSSIEMFPLFGRFG